MPERLVEWDSMEVRVAGSRVETLAREAMSRPEAPVDDLRLQFSSGELRVSARLKRGLPVPVRLVVRRIETAGRTLKVRLEDLSAMGLPLPSLLTRLVGNRQAADGIHFDATTSSLLIQLDRFLPSFLEVEVSEIRIIDGGLLVRLGSGGADLPFTPGGAPWDQKAT